MEILAWLLACLFTVVVFLAVTAGVSALVGALIWLAYDTVHQTLGLPPLSFVQVWAIWFILVSVLRLLKYKG